MENVALLVQQADRMAKAFLDAAELSEAEKNAMGSDYRPTEDAAIDAAMTLHLEEAAVAHEVRTAHLTIDPIGLADVITVPLPPLLERAHHRLQTAGWCAGSLTDDDAAVCLIVAIQEEADGDGDLAPTPHRSSWTRSGGSSLTSPCPPSTTGSAPAPSRPGCCSKRSASPRPAVGRPARAQPSSSMTRRP
ncbi:hypothetical protein [Streptomyces sp. NPDC088135]|uniref:DUF6197 family protein n=1 Tax=Streptomyces sp. NPDC088135 TaxID=3160993 RepID=UPI003435BA60